MREREKGSEQGKREYLVIREVINCDVKSEIRQEIIYTVVVEIFFSEMNKKKKEKRV